MSAKFIDTFTKFLNILNLDDQLVMKTGLVSVKNGHLNTPIGDILPLLTKQKSLLQDQFVNLKSLKKLIDNLNVGNAIIRLNHIGFCYKVDSLETEKIRLVSLLKKRKVNLYIEPSNDDSVWFFIGNTDDWEDPMVELLPTAQTSDQWKDYWLPHVQIDIDTTLSEGEIKKHIQTIFGESITPFSIVIDGVVYIVRNRLGTISGINLILDLATKSRNVKYQRLHLLKPVRV